MPLLSPPPSTPSINPPPTNHPLGEGGPLFHALSPTPYLSPPEVGPRYLALRLEGA